MAVRSKRRRAKPTPVRGAPHQAAPVPKPPDTAAGRGHAPAGRALSGREQEIIGLLIGGRSVKEASAALGLSPRTVEGYLERLKQRFRHPRLLSLVVYLVKLGLVE